LRATSVGVEVELVGDATWLWLDRREVGGVERDGVAVDVGDGKGNFEGGDGGDAAVELTMGWVKPGIWPERAGVEAVGAGVGGEVEVEGAVFLEEDEDVLHFLAEELEFGRVGEEWLVLNWNLAKRNIGEC
jgi:hypothetical protein